MELASWGETFEARTPLDSWPAQIPSPVEGEQIFREGGRGIYLINQLMDEVRFEKGGTEIHMRLNPPAAR